MWKAVLAGLRNMVGGGMAGKLLFAGAIIALFGAAVLVPRLRAHSTPNGPFGNWMGVVQITKSRPDGSFTERTEDEGRAVLHVEISPVWISFLDRTKATAVLIDKENQMHTFRIDNLSDGWQLPARWKAAHLLDGPPDETLTARWNQSFTDFTLRFDSYRNNELSNGVKYQIKGSLQRGDAQLLQKLTASLHP